ncbi:MAG: hypothetical protein AB1728_11065 [Bacteroidota bacterium]
MNILCVQERISISDLAYECIAPIFALDNRKQFYRIRAFVDSLPCSLVEMEEKTLFVVFRSCLGTVINTEAAKYHIELDPIGAKVLRGLKLAVKQSNSSRLSEGVFGTLLEPTMVDLLDHAHEFPIELLERNLVGRSAMFKKNPAFIHTVVTVLAEQDEYRRAVLLYDLVTLRKKYLQFEEKELLINSEIDSSFDHYILHEEIGALRNSVLRYIQRKVTTLYADTRKLDSHEASILSNTMSSIIDRWFSNDGNDLQYFEHLRGSHPITKKEYDLYWKTKVEYLVKLAKMYIVEKNEV